MFAQLITAVLALSAAVSALPTLSTRTSTTCSANSQTNLDNLSCPVLISASAFSYFQADSANTEADTVLGTVVDLIKTSAPNKDIGTIVSAGTSGLTGNLLTGVTEFLYAAASTLQELSSDCRYNAELCYNDLKNAAGDGSAGTVNTQAACAEAKYACGAFYTSDQVNKMVPACAKYTSATNA